MMEERNSSATPTPITGLARVDGRIRNLVTRIEPGEIAIIDQSDLDRASARALVSKAPIAVLNAAPSSSGRHFVLGPRILLDAGILVIDDLGPDIMTVREGETLQVRGHEILRAGDVIANGHLLDASDLENDEREQRRMISTQIGSFAASIDEYLERDGALLKGEGVPTYREEIDGHPVLLVLDDEQANEDLKSLKRWITDAAPIVFGIDGGANLAKERRLKPTFVVGDMDQMKEGVLRHAKHRILRRGHDGLTAGRERLDRMGLGCETIEMSGTSEDAALLVATHSGASSIVIAGASHDLDDFVDRGRSAMAPSFFTRLGAGDALVSAKAVAATHRPRISSTWLVFLLIAMLAGLGAAFWSTPLGQDLFRLLVEWGTNHTAQEPAALTALIQGAFAC